MINAILNTLYYFALFAGRQINAESSCNEKLEKTIILFTKVVRT